jgi:N-acetylglucosamine malate deacetylase 1
MNKKILVVAAHPDDEVLGCGGTMARHVNNGDKVYVVFMSDGVSSRVNAKDNEMSERESCAKKSSKILGAQIPRFFNFPDNRMDTIPMLDIVQPLEEVICKIEPEVVYTHHSGDLNIDHQITNQATMTACRPQPGKTISEIYTFEILSSTGWGAPTVVNVFTPNTFIEITDVWKKKVEALYCYDTELIDFPHARSYKGIEALAIYRGSSVGVKHAEAFSLERRII